MKRTRWITLFFMGLISMPVVAFQTSLSFDDQKLGERCDGLSATRGYISKSKAHSGDFSCLFWIKKGKTGWGTWGGVIDFPKKLGAGDEVWFRVRTFMPDDFDYTAPGEGGRLKFLRVPTKSKSGGKQGHDDFYINGPSADPPYGFIYEGEQKWLMFGEGAHRIRKGRWETWEMYLKLDPVTRKDGGQALVRIWKNGELIMETTKRQTLANDQTYADSAYVFTYWNGGSPRDQHMYVDDVAITSETPSSRDSYGHPFLGLRDEAQR